MSEIRLSKKHGVNPSVDHCFICGKEYGIVLFGKLKGDVEAPMSTCTGGICDECEKVRAAGAIFLIEMDEKKTVDMKYPQKTGRIVGLRREVVERIVQPKDLCEQILERGLAFLPIEAYEMLGLHEFGEKELDDE